MSPFVLSVLKYTLLVLLYFFVFRAVRSVAVDVAGRRRAPKRAGGRAPAVATPSKGKPPTQVLVHEPEGRKARSVRLSGPLEIGRRESSAVRLDDTYVSQVHARLFPRDGVWHVEDLGSTNGTFLNDRRVAAPVEVHAGDVVRVGKTLLELRR
ncbi:MAG TPA: FHA domain-containing protein [Actinomycetota bacterium]|nr:FHA domain-containing protein [Actinomycetota bacterium]